MTMTPLRRSPRLGSSTASVSASNSNTSKRKKQNQSAANVVTPTPTKKSKNNKIATVSTVSAAIVASSLTTTATTTAHTAAAAFSSNPKSSCNKTRLRRALFSSSSHRTESFGALCGDPPVIPPHTLILGTHPSETSLAKQRYYGYDRNAFWWIAGDCLGFRRGPGLKKPKSGRPDEYYKFTDDLRVKDFDRIIPYEQQVQRLTSHGFALWDVVKSCQRKGSLDADIRNEEPNDIKAFCQRYRTSIKRIVFANGGTGSKMFNKHFTDWWEEDPSESPLTLVPATDEFSTRAFDKVYKRRQASSNNTKTNDVSPDSSSSSSSTVITCICALSVSPAAASYTYKEKRDFWEQHVYQPGLQDYYRYRDSIEQQQQQDEEVTSSKKSKQGKTSSTEKNDINAEKMTMTSQDSSTDKLSDQE